MEGVHRTPRQGVILGEEPLQSFLSRVASVAKQRERAGDETRDFIAVKEALGNLRDAIAVDCDEASFLQQRVNARYGDTDAFCGIGQRERGFIGAQDICARWNLSHTGHFSALGLQGLCPHILSGDCRQASATRLTTRLATRVGYMAGADLFISCF